MMRYTRTSRTTTVHPIMGLTLRQSTEDDCDARQTVAMVTGQLKRLFAQLIIVHHHESIDNLLLGKAAPAFPEIKLHMRL